jgi:hypothetical protein
MWISLWACAVEPLESKQDFQHGETARFTELHGEASAAYHTLLNQTLTQTSKRLRLRVFFVVLRGSSC